MANFCFFRVEKRKSQDLTGLMKEANREYKDPTKYNNKVDLSKSPMNVYLVKSNEWLRDAQKAIKAAGIQKYRCDAVTALTGLYTASADALQRGWLDVDGYNHVLCEDYFTKCLEWHEKHYGQVISAVIHYDESTPHLHVTSVPITNDGRLSAKDIVGNRTKLQKAQDSFWEDVGQNFYLDRGIKSDRKHLTEIQYAAQKALEELEQTQRQQNQAAEELENVQAEIDRLLNEIAKDDSQRNKRERKYREAILKLKENLDIVKAYLEENQLLDDFRYWRDEHNQNEEER